jgi:U32 family peptidase
MTKKDYAHIELLAPAGSYESLHAAIAGGCDAIYFGVSGFNMRANTAAAFGEEDIKEIASICHENNIQCYLALNTLVYDEGVDHMKKMIDAVKEAGVDAIISYDMTAISYACSVGVEVHISTQHSISNIEAVKFFSQWSDRVVLARELTLEQIKHITEQIKKQDVRGPKGELVEVEVFIHGAMCVSVSGRCGMSLYMYGTSANCGKCSQPCRRSYKVTDEATGKALVIDHNYVMSPEDLCTIGMIGEIMDSGVVSLKIEGRGRKPEYVDEVVRCYREAIEAVKADVFDKEKVTKWNKRLGTVYNRGMSEGFYRGKAFSYWSKGPNSKAKQRREFVGRIEKYYPKISVAEVAVQAAELESGASCIITGKNTGVLRTSPEGIQLDGKEVQNVKQGDLITFKVPSTVHRGDQLYKLVENK